MTTYRYSVSQSIPHGKVATDRLSREINATAAITVKLDHIATDSDDCFIVFCADLGRTDKQALDGIVLSHSGEPLPEDIRMMAVAGISPTAQGRFPTASARPVAPKLTFITPNWCDKTTWYTGSAEVTGETATDTGNHATYSLTHQYVIDAYHGKITFEDILKDNNGHSYRVFVRVNGVLKTEQDPHYTSGGDFTVNYAAGTITFLADLQPTDVVTVTYHYAVSATFVIKPDPGKRLYIGTVEVQFSDDVVLNDTFVFQAYGLVDYFAPFLMAPPYNLPSGYKIPLGDPLIYKTFNDFLNDSNGAYPGYPSFGGNNWRSLKKAAYIFVWDYTVGSTCLEAAAGMEIRIDLQHNEPCGGAYGVATLYCTSESE